MRSASENQLNRFGGGDAPAGFVQKDNLTIKEINRRMNAFLRGRGLPSHQLATLEQKQTILKKTAQLETKRRARGNWRERLKLRARLALRKLRKSA